MKTQTTKTILDDLFREEALLLGGIAAIYPMDDQVVTRMVRGLEHLRHRYLRRVLGDGERGAGREQRDTRNTRSIFQPHPAIEKFLRSIRADEDGQEPSWADSRRLRAARRQKEMGSDVPMR